MVLLAAISLSMMLMKTVRAWHASRKPIKLILDDSPLSPNAGYWFGVGIRKEALRDAQASEPSAVFTIGDWTKDVGNIGELITTLLHVTTGWRQLPSQPDGDHGIDGIFVRKKKAGYEVRFVETKTVTDSDPLKWYREDQLSAVGLRRRLDTLRRIYEPADKQHMCQGNIDALKNAIDRRSVHISSLLYGHILKTGETHIYSANKDGDLNIQSKVTLNSDEHHYIFEGLAIGLSRFDRRNRYIQDQVAMADNNGEDLLEGRDHIQEIA